MKEKNYKKIMTRITPEENKKMEDLAKWCGFKSTYSLLRYIVLCFLRASDHKSGSAVDLPPEIIKLFAGTYKMDAEIISRAVRNIKNRKIWRETKRRQRHPDPKSRVHSEVADLFSDCEDQGTREWKADINKRL
jgi:hypothetical protein